MGEVLVVPLGGLNEIGLNLLAIESEAGLIVVDCGLLVASQEYPGIDYLIPDFHYLRERRERLLALFLTHGHDDHVGAVPHFLKEFPVPVFGTAFTLELLDSRMKEVAPACRKLLRRVPLGAQEQIGPFRCEFLRVTHSVPDSAAIAVETPEGTVLCTGDFKFDPDPVDGLLSDEAGLARWGARGVDLLCCDSTNASCPGMTPSERGVGLALRKRFLHVAGRVYLSTFASHIHRIQQVIEASREVGRVVTFAGRSVAANVRSARRLGLLKAAPDDIVPEARALAMPRERVTVVLAGAQGEAGSALQRAVSGNDPRLALQPGDELFLSARVIPGCERAVGRLVDDSLGRGCAVHRGENAGIHASGHASADDITRMFDLVRPRHVLPIHGERRHREALALLARGWGLAESRVFCVGNGETLRLCKGTVTSGMLAPVGRTFVETGNEGGEDDPLLRDRRRLGRRGLALVTAAVRADGTLMSGPRVTLRGVLPRALAEEGAAAAEDLLLRSLASMKTRWVGVAELEQEWEVVMRRQLRKILPENPVVVVQVAEIDSGVEAPLQ